MNTVETSLGEALLILLAIGSPAIIMYSVKKMDEYVDTYEYYPSWLDLALKDPPIRPFYVAYRKHNKFTKTSMMHVLVFDDFIKKINFIKKIHKYDDGIHRHTVLHITKDQIKYHIRIKPKKYSDEYYGIIRHDMNIPGCVGYVGVCNILSGHSRIFETY